MSMKHAETLLPRTLAVIVMLVSLSMLVPLAKAVIAVVHGAVPIIAMWLAPLLILATGLALLLTLGRRAVVPLYLMALALWVITAGYFLVRLVF
jgi:hypothetical protein